MKHPLIIMFASFIGLALSGDFALAKDADPKIRKAENCFKAGWISKKLRKLAKLKADKTDTVGVAPTAQLILEDKSQHFADRFFIKEHGEETNLIIASDGQLLGFETLQDYSDDVELCHVDLRRAGLPFDADGISLDVNTDIQFHNQSGLHSLDEINDGLKDGKSHYKKMVGAMSVFVPNMSHVMVKYDDAAQPLAFTAMKGDVALDEPIEIVYCDLPMIKVKDLEAIGADSLRILGGPYRLLPVPSLAAMKRFEGCGDA